MKKLLFLAITSLLLTSCNSDDEIGNVVNRCEFPTTYSHFYDSQKFKFDKVSNQLVKSVGENTVFEIKTVPPTCPSKTIGDIKYDLEQNTYRILFQIPNNLTQVNWSGKELEKATPILEVINKDKKVIAHYLMNDPKNYIKATKKRNEWNVSYSLKYKTERFNFESENSNVTFTQKRK